MDYSAAVLVGGIFAFIAATFSWIFIVPKERQLSPFFSRLRDFFNFKDLWIEAIFKYFYILATCSCWCVGFFLLFWRWNGRGEWLGYYGLLVMLLGPVFVRIFYEFTMMFILAVKNIMEINQKLGTSHVVPPAPSASEMTSAPAPVPAAAPAPPVTPKEETAATEQSSFAWEEAKRLQGGAQMGKCGCCGKRGQELVRAVFEDFFGVAEYDMCCDCFHKHNAKLHIKKEQAPAVASPSTAEPPAPATARVPASAPSASASPSASDNYKRRAKWDEAQRAQGVFHGKCELCGAKKAELVHAEFTDFFGSTEYDMCFSCFCDRKAVPKRKSRT